MFQEDDDAQLNKETWTVVKTLRYATLSGERIPWELFPALYFNTGPTLTLAF